MVYPGEYIPLVKPDVLASVNSDDVDPLFWDVDPPRLRAI